MIRKFIGKKFFAVVFILSIFISITAAWHWFSGGSILYFWDSYVPFDPKISFNNLFYFWQDRIFPGFATPGTSWFLYWFLIFLPRIVNPSLSLGEFFVHVLLLSATIINCYLFIRFVLHSTIEGKDNIIKLVSLGVALLYTFNIYTFFNFYFMFNPGAFVLAFLPLNLLALLNLYPLDQTGQNKKKNVWLAVFIISLFLMSPGLGIYIIFLQYLVWIFLYLLWHFIVSGKRIISGYALELVLFYCLTIFINLWWFIPAFLNLQLAYSGQSTFGTRSLFEQGFKDIQLLNSIRFFGSALMANNKFAWSSFYENSLFTFPLFLLPFLLITSLIFLSKKVFPKTLLFFLGMFLVSLFIVKFSNPPFAWILEFGFNHIPFFGAFRDSFQKVGIYYTLPYFIFISLGFIYLIEKLKSRKMFLSSFILLSFLAAIVLSGPFFLFIKNNIRTISFSYNNKNYTISAKTKIPKEYTQLASFLNKNCIGETVMEIPRSGFVTNAIWEKYGTSYAGQDILPAIINCNFLTTATFSSNSEASIEAPYFLLEQGDFESVRFYLIQNNIRFILIRKDFVPQSLVTWTYVDPQTAENYLIKDKDFTKIFSNDFASVYEFKNIFKKQYGFTLSKNVAYVPTGLKTGFDYMATYKALKSLNTQVVLNTKTSNNTLRNNTDVVNFSSNCIGCVKISNQDLINKNSNDLIANLKKIIKSTLQRNTVFPEDKKISLDILSSEDKLKSLINAAGKGDYRTISFLIKEYKKIWKDIFDEIKNYKADKFSINNKHIEATNFLNIQKNTPFSYLSSQIFKPNQLLNEPKYRDIFINLFNFQKKLYEKLSEETIQTNFNKSSYWARLDVPTNRDYLCQIVQKNKLADIKSVSLEGKYLDVQQYSNKSPISLKKGSYLLNINYVLNNIRKYDSIPIKSNDFTEVSLGYLDKGLYNLTFKIPSNYGGRLLVLIYKGKISLQSIEKTTFTTNVSNIKSKDPKVKSNVKIVDTVDVNYENGMRFARSFDVDFPERGDYYFYLYFLNSTTSNAYIKDLSLDTTVSDDNFIFNCLTKTNKILNNNTSLYVIKNNPTSYLVKVPNGYSRFLTFNQTFDSNWIAYYKNTNLKLPHFENGYSNAWYLNSPQSLEIIIKYSTQEVVEKAAVLSIALTVLLIALYLIIRNKNGNT